MNLSSADKQLLLQVARESIAAHLQGKAATPVKATSPVLGESGEPSSLCIAGGNSGVASAILKPSNLSCKR